MNSGAEAVETAIKLARNGVTKSKEIKDGYAKIIVCRKQLHGKNYHDCFFFSNDKDAHNNYGPFTPGF